MANEITTITGNGYQVSVFMDPQRCSCSAAGTVPKQIDKILTELANKRISPAMMVQLIKDEITRADQKVPEISTQ